MNYLYDFVTLLCIYSILAIGLNLLIGYIGIFSMSHAALFGVGAYTSALLSTKLGWGFIPSLLAAILVAILFSIIVALPSLRIAGDYFIVASFSLQIIIFELFVTWTDLTNGPAGIAGIPMPSIFGLKVNTPFSYMIFALFFLFLTVILTYRVIHSPVGRVLRAIKEDPIAVQSLGKSVIKTKVINAVLSSGLAGLAGSLYAHKITYINPASFDVHESILIAAMVILAGAGRVWGSIVGALIVLAFPELLRFLDISGSHAGAIQKILYGVILILFMIYRPQGIFGKFKDSNLVKAK
jgi:branched-chain amino acid transport system permease protein